MRRRAAPKRRASHRERVERRERRVVAPDVISPPATPRPADIAWTGVVGGGLGFALLIGLAAAIAAGASDASELWAIPFAAFSTLFLAAALVSWRPVAQRRLILRYITVGSIVLAVAGSIVAGAELAMVLSAPIALLSNAAGFIFQGGVKQD